MLLCLALSACASGPQTTEITQFSQAITTSTNAEDGLFDVVTQRTADVQNLCILSASSITISDSGQIIPTRFRCQTNTIPTSLKAAIDTILKAVQAYATALQALASDTAGTTFSTNVDALGKSISAVDTNILTPLGGKGGPTTAQVGAVGAAVKDIGGALIAFAISRDVQKAAQGMQAPLHSIATNLAAINLYWVSSGIATEQSTNIKAYVTVLWPKLSFTDRQKMQAMVSSDFAPVSADAVNKALTGLAVANDKIATAGPTLSIAEIQSALQAANDAVAAVKAFQGSK